MDRSLHDIFIQEAEENLIILENSIISIEENPDDEKNINEAFRAIHSIKGGAGLAGFGAMKDFTHIVEDLLEYIRSGVLKAGAEHISVILEALDIIKAMTANIRSDRPAGDGLDTTTSVEKISAIIRSAGGHSAEAAAGSGSSAGTAAAPSTRLFYLSLEFPQEIFSSGIDPAMFLADLSRAGTILYVETDTEAFPDDDSFDPERFYLKWRLFLESGKSGKDIADIFIFVIDESNIVIEEITDDAAASRFTVGGRKVTDFRPVGSADAGATAEAEAEAEAVAANPAGTEDFPAEERRQGGRRATDRREADSSSASFIRVQTEKLEDIFNSVSELLISQARLNMLTEEYEEDLSDDFSAVADSLKNITGILQEQITSLRMMGLGSTFDRFRRVVRDIASERGKKVRFEVEGQETELDKNMIEKLNDPLKHLVRNCIDHGIETEEERIRKGKNPEGTLSISATIENGKVVLEVRDDGAGIDRQKLLKKAVERRIVQDNHSMSDGDVLNLIFHPGLSTADQVTDLSGRGVGMDVVKSSIMDLHGEIEVNSERDRGTVFRLHLPLTLAILDGMLVGIGAEKYILPTLSILEIFKPQQHQLKTISGRGEVVFFRGEYIPLIRVHEVLSVSGCMQNPADAELIVVFSGGTKAALMVDNVMEQFQIVLKSLQKNFRKVEHISSATILGNGDVALILDIQSILQSGAALQDVSKV